MTGPEHYLAAERLIEAGRYPTDSRVMVVASPDKIALAQVHATLALAAAYAMRGNSVNVVGDWPAVAGTGYQP